MLQKAFRVLKSDQPFKRALAVVNKSPLRHINRQAVDSLYRSNRKHRKFEKSASQQELSLVSQLNQNGYVDLTEYLEPSLRQEAMEFYQARLDSQVEQSVQTKDFWTRLSDLETQAGKVSAEHPLVKSSLDVKLLDLVSTYFGEVPFLRYSLVTLSHESKESFKSSQLWHQDRDDVRMLKFFIYLSDVDEEAQGPFTLLPKPVSEKVKNSFFMEHLNDARVTEQGIELDKEVIKMYGKKLSCFLVDTSRCYHMGSRITDGQTRLMLTSLFTCLPSIYKGATRQWIQPEANLKPTQLMAISAETTGELSGN